MPAPFSPTTPTRSPRRMVRSTSLEDRVAAELDADTSSSSTTRSPPRLCAAQLERDPAPLEHRPVDLLHPVDLALLVARLLDVALVDDAARPVLEAPDRLLEPRDLLLLRDVELLLPLQLELARDRVGGVVAGPDADLPVVRARRSPSTRLVEQVAVVRDQRRRRRRSRASAPRARSRALDVEVRLGLVEQQHVRVARARQAASATSLRWPPESSPRRLLERRRSRGRARRGCAGAPVEAGRRRLPSSARAAPPGRRGAGRSRRGRRPRRRGRARRRRAPARARRGRAGRHGVSRRGAASSPSTLLRQEGEHEPAPRASPSPASASSSPARMRSSVDLPPPFGPITPMRAPASTSKSSSSRICREPKLFATPRACSSDIRRGRSFRRSRRGCFGAASRAARRPRG